MMKSWISGSAFLLLVAFGAGAATINGTVKTSGGAGTAIEGVKVVLLAAGGNGARQDSTVTNAAGVFTFTVATTGFRAFQASKTGYQNGQGFVNVADAGGTYTAAITMNAIPVPGQPGKVSGTVRASTATGAVIAGATVIISRGGGGGGGGGGGAFLDTAVTNAQGIYTFDSIPANTNYTVRVTATGYNLATDNNVDVVAGTTTTTNVILTPTPPPPPPGTVTGTVRATSGTGALIAGAQVIISTAGGINGAATPLDTVVTNAQGVYTINPVPVGNNYIVRVTAVGYDPGVNNNVDVTTATATTANFTLVVNPNAGMPGSIAGTVRDSASAAVAAAKVMLLRGNVKVDSAVTGTDGRYSFPSVEALQNYTLIVSKTGYQTVTNNNVDVSANTTSTTDFRLDLTGVSRTLGMIGGIITDVAAKGIANATVIIVRNGAGGSRDTAKTDAGGHYLVDSLMAGTGYSVTVSAVGFQNALNGNVTVVAGQVSVTEFILIASAVQIATSEANKSGFHLANSRGVFAAEFNASPWAGRLSIYGIRGALVFSSSVASGSVQMNLPALQGMHYLVLERGGQVERLAIPMGR